MSKYYDGALVMPKGHAVMNEEEMTYVEGGDHHEPMSEKLDSKSYCGGLAQWLFASQKVKRMSIHDMVVELYAHAVCYYHYDKVALVFGVAPAYYCYTKAADGVTLMDGGDSSVRKAFYKAVFELF